MSTPTSARTLRLPLAGAFVLTIGATTVFWVEARGTVPGSVGFALAAPLLILAARGFWVARRTAAEKASLKAQIDQFSSSLECFVVDLAHEIKVPLTIALNQLELLQRCGDDVAVIRGHAKSLADYVLHLADLFDGMLRLEVPVMGEATSDHDPVHVHDLVVETVRRTGSTAHAHGVAVVATLAESGSEDEAPEVLGHAVLLEAMLENVVRDAVLRSPRASPVELKVEVQGESIQLHVRDRGPGIAPSHLASVFDWCREEPRASRASGAGFGLAIAKRIAEHHRGEMSLQNHPAGGSQFEITLPRFRSGTVTAQDRDTPREAFA